jgi:hypothetical protein
MPHMSRRVRQKVAAAAAIAVLAAGGAFAAVSATGQGNLRRPSSAQRHAQRAHAKARDLAAAASYLGISKAALASELRAGKSLAQVASATAGKSVGGLIEAIEAAKKARLSAQAARLPKRVANEVNRTGGPAGAQAAGKHKQAREAKRLANLRKRVAKLVQRQAPSAAAGG